MQSSASFSTRFEERRQVLWAIELLLFVVAGGTAGFMLIEGWDFWRSFFFTMITITTVGYGAEGLTKAGEQFTSILLLGGIATATYAFSVIVQSAVVNEVAWKKRILRQIARLENHYIICGFGRIGRSVAAELSENDIPYVIIESHEPHYNYAIDHDCLAISGSAVEDEVLIAAGIKQAKGVVSVVDQDSENIVITLSARELNPDATIIARSDSDGSGGKIRRAGADHIVSPFSVGGKQISDLIIRPHFSSLFSGSSPTSTGLQLGEIVLIPESKIVGQTIAQCGARTAKEIVFVAIQRGDQTMIRPGGDETFERGDIVLVAGPPESVKELAAKAAETGWSRKRRPASPSNPGSP